MPTCDPLIYEEILDPVPPLDRSLISKPAGLIISDVSICNENGSGITTEPKPWGFGSGDQSSIKICSEGTSARCGFREMERAVNVGSNNFISDDVGSWPKNQYVNNSEIVLDIDNASSFSLKISRLDRQYTFLLKSDYHKTSSDGENNCVGYVRETPFGDLYVFTDGTSDSELTELPAERSFSIEELPNHGKFIFEVRMVNGKPATDSTRKILLYIEYTGSTSGTFDVYFEEFFDYIALGGGSVVVDDFVFTKPAGFSTDYIMMPGSDFDLGASSSALFEITINNPTMYVVDPAYIASCIPNYDENIHNRFSKTLIINRLL